MNLNIQATAPQAEFLTLQKRYRLFCAGYGAGKSEAMVYAALIDAASAPSSLVACYAPTNDLVKLITAPRIIEKLDDLGVNYKFREAGRSRGQLQVQQAGERYLHLQS